MNYTTRWTELDMERRLNEVEVIGGEPEIASLFRDLFRIVHMQQSQIDALVALRQRDIARRTPMWDGFKVAEVAR